MLRPVFGGSVFVLLVAFLTGVKSQSIWVVSLSLAFISATLGVLRFIISPPLRLTPVDLTGKVAIVTGSNSGVGKETARTLASWNATVILACRDLKKGEAAAADIRTSLTTGVGATDDQSKAQVLVWELDLASLASVRAFIQRFHASGLPLHILVNNGGVRYHAHRLTGDNLELHYQVNHLGHFLLTLGLVDRLKASAPARIVHVSSSAHALGLLDRKVYEDGNRDEAAFNLIQKTRIEGVYGDTKLMQVVFSKELNERLQGSGVTSFAVHPGFVATDFGKEDKRWLQTLLVITRPLLARSPEQGSMSVVYAATSPDLAGAGGGAYIDNCAVGRAALPAEFDAGPWLWRRSAVLVKWTAADGGDLRRRQCDGAAA